MNAPQSLHDKGQSLWLDNITRDLLDNGTMKRYIDEYAITGLTSNPTIFDLAIKNSGAYDQSIAEKVKKGKVKKGRGSIRKVKKRRGSIREKRKTDSIRLAGRIEPVPRPF